jgi:hypothetical protein
MPAPFFSADGSRVFYMRSAASGNAELVSVQRDGTDEKVHLQVKYGEEFALSPDQKWVAYKKLHDAYLAPMPAPGTGPLELGDSDGAVKVYALTDDMADWLSWEDATTLTWSQANDLYRTTVDDVIAKNAPKEEDEAEGEDEEEAEEVDETEEPRPSTRRRSLSP